MFKNEDPNNAGVNAALTFRNTNRRFSNGFDERVYKAGLLPAEKRIQGRQLWNIHQHLWMTTQKHSFLSSLELLLWETRPPASEK